MGTIGTELAKAVEQLSSFSSFPLYASAIGALVIAGISSYIGMQFGMRKAKPAPLVVGDIDAMAERLTEAEKIGRFGSFMWDFEDPQASFWSDEMFLLLDIEYARKPPTPEEFLAFAYTDDRELVAREWAGVKVHPGSFSFTFRAVTKTGRLMHLKVEGKTTMGDGKDAKRIAGVIHDVTKEMEVDRAKSEFVSLASHQLKTPLTSIRWLAEGLLRGTVGKLAEEQEKYVVNMHEAAQRMMDMVNDLLNVSRIEKDTLAVKPEPLDVCALAQNVLDEQRHAAVAKQLKLQFTCAADIPQMQADKNLTRIIFQNLLSNAIKYTPEKGVVECTISLAETSRESVFVKVSDSGIGIPKDEQPRVFEKLHRATNAQALVPDGTGLGLYLVKTIVDRVGGGITLESVEGKGTTFYVSIPVIWKASGEKPLAS